MLKDPEFFSQKDYSDLLVTLQYEFENQHKT